MIIPGILEKDFDEVVKKINLVQSECEVISIDIIDSTLFEGATFLEPEKLDSINVSSTLELHLITKTPLKYVRNKINNVKKVLAQVEGDNIDEFLDVSKQTGYICGLSIDIKTPLSNLEKYVEQISYVQFMTISTGASGRPFRMDSLEKIKDFRRKHPKIRIQTDGGGNKETIPLLKEAGVDDFAVTSAIFNSADPLNELRDLKMLIS